MWNKKHGVNMEFSRTKEAMFASLGGGKPMDEENQLIQAPEEEEDFDVLNAETFGDIEDGDYDWEEHNRMACEMEGSSFFDLEENHTKDSGFITMDQGHSTIMTEEELEQSINRLMVEDGEGKAFFTATGRPIPGAHQRRDVLQNSQVEYKSLGSPGKNIWGSPLTESPLQKPVSNKLQALFASAKQAAHRDFPGVFGQAGSATPLAGLPTVPVPSKAPTLAEIEHNMLARENQKPKVLTAEEVERQLRGDPPLGQEVTGSTPVPIPPAGTAVAFRKPHVAQGPTMSMRGLAPRLPHNESSPISILPRPNQMTGIPGSHESPLGRSPSPSQVMMHPGMLAHSPRLVSPYNPAAIIMANHMMRPPPGPGVISPFGSPNLSTAVMASRMPVPPAMVDQHVPVGGLPPMIYPTPIPHAVPPQMQPYPAGRHHVSNNLSTQLPQAHLPAANDRNANNSRPGGGGRSNERHPYNRSGNGGVSNGGHGEVDDYAGLMTSKEKDWIIKIQLMQLQTDNPYLDDYYFTYHRLKKATSPQEANPDSMPDLELLIPSMSKSEPRIYTPAQFEGSLGRLTAASVHNPRQIIDVCRKNNDSPTADSQKNVSKELRRYRQLLMDIEKGFGILLDVDDLEKKVMALPAENRLSLFEERREKIELIFSYFMQDDSLKNFAPTISVRKGRKLLARLMPLLDKVQWLSIVTVLLSHLTNLLKKDVEEEGLSVLMPPMKRYLSQCDLECLVHFATILQKHPKQNEEGLALLLHSSFGISLLSILLKTGEEIFKNTSPVDIDNQLKTQWHQFLEEFIDTLESVPKDRLAWPDTHQPCVYAHVDRFINDKQIGAVEDKLAHFSQPRPARLGEEKRQKVRAS